MHHNGYNQRNEGCGCSIAVNYRIKSPGVAMLNLKDIKNCLAVACLGAVCVTSCASGGGGGGSASGASDGPSSGQEVANENAMDDSSFGDNVQDDNSNEPDTPSVEFQECGVDVSSGTGGAELPHYELLPAPNVPRIILEQERPAQVDISDLVPTPCSQGALNSCVGWAGGYYLMTYLAAANDSEWRQLDRTDRHFSPTFVFNQANAFRLGRSMYDSCLLAGTFLSDLFVLLRDTGNVTWSQVPYTVDECQAQPDDAITESATEFRINTFFVVPQDRDTIQAYLNVGVPLIVNVRAGDLFNQLEAGTVYDDVELDTFTHSVMVVGYDDDLGAFKFVNSWGPSWADGGFGFIGYDAWPLVVHEIYVSGKDLIDPDAVPVPAKSSILQQSGNGLVGCAFNPLRDSDGDGYADGVERIFRDFGFDPDVAQDNPDLQLSDDDDGDGWPNDTELTFGTDPNDEHDYPYDCDFDYPGDFFEPTSTATGRWGGGLDYRLGHEWLLPDGTALTATADEFGPSGAVTLRRDESLVGDGFYWLTLRAESEFNLGGPFAQVAYEASLLNYTFTTTELLPIDSPRTIGIDVFGGQPIQLYNLWLGLADPALRINGSRAVEAQAAWSFADPDNVKIQVELAVPNEATLTGFASDTGSFGFTRLPVADEIVVEDGTYVFTFEITTTENNASAEADFRVKLLGFSFASSQTVVAGENHTVALTVDRGQVFVAENTLD